MDRSRRKIRTFGEALRVLDRVAGDAQLEFRRVVFLKSHLALNGLKEMRESMPNWNNAARDLREKSVDQLHQAREKVMDVSKDAAKKVDEHAHKRPWHFVGIAALFASMLGFLLGRKTKR